jgi:putative selenate reductase YgfK subunit
MTNYLCPVKKLVNKISEIPSFQTPQSECRKQIQMLLELLDDICNGKGRTNHLAVMNNLAESLMKDDADKVCMDLGRIVASALDKDRDVFLSHIEAHYCPSGDCVTLSAAPCQLACPASVDAPSYVALVGMGRYKEALEVLREDLPLPGTLSRICVHPCEKACRRGAVDEPIAICRLKRVAFDMAYEEGLITPQKPPHRFEEKIAVIGSGPAGLSTAYFLAKKGYRPTIFESTSEPGGMLRWWIPAYRLPRDILDLEIDYIKAMGVDIHTGVAFGKNISLESLKKQGFQAIFLGIGAHRPMRLAIQGEQDFSGVQDGLNFLYAASKGIAEVGKRVMIIGGGNAAVDCARTALRLNTEEVHLVYRRTKREMPAHAQEIQALEEEGAILDFLLSPIRIHGENGKVVGLECIRNGLSQPDATGRRRPLPLQGTEHILPADTIICAIGQEVDTQSLRSVNRLELSQRQLITVDPVTMETSAPGVFAGGDVVTGPATVIEAVASGKKAAEAIHRSLRGTTNPEFTLIPVRRQQVQVIEMSSQEKSFPSRPVMPMVDLVTREGSFQEVELGMSVNSAIQEARRCLRCDICISCGQCIEVCRNQMGVDAIHLSYVEQNATEETDFRRPADYCIGCGACALTCPTAAIDMQDKDGMRTLRMCGTEMAQHRLVACTSCGSSFVSQKQLTFVLKRLDDNPTTKYSGHVCPACARKINAENLIGGFFVS